MTTFLSFFSGRAFRDDDKTNHTNPERVQGVKPKFDNSWARSTITNIIPNYQWTGSLIQDQNTHEHPVQWRGISLSAGGVDEEALIAMGHGRHEEGAGCLLTQCNPSACVWGLGVIIFLLF